MITPFVHLCLEAGSCGKERATTGQAREDEIKLAGLWQDGEVQSHRLFGGGRMEWMDTRYGYQPQVINHKHPDT